MPVPHIEDSGMRIEPPDNNFILFETENCRSYRNLTQGGIKIKCENIEIGCGFKTPEGILLEKAEPHDYLYFIELKDLRSIDLTNPQELTKWKVQLFKKTMDSIAIANTIRYKTNWFTSEYKHHCLDDSDYVFQISDNFLFQVILVINIETDTIDINPLCRNLETAIQPYLKIYDYPTFYKRSPFTPVIWLGDYERAKIKWRFIC